MLEEELLTQLLENNIITDLHNVFSSLESLHNHMKNVQNIIRNTDDEYIKTKYKSLYENVSYWVNSLNAIMDDEKTKIMLKKLKEWKTFMSEKFMLLYERDSKKEQKRNHHRSEM